MPATAAGHIVGKQVGQGCQGENIDVDHALLSGQIEFGKKAIL